MAITGSTPQQYQDAINNGGTLTYTVDSIDISENEFEELSSIKPMLYKGFEIPPSTIIHDPAEAAQIYMHGDNWTRIVTTTYLKGGRVIYKKLPSGQFQATCTIPAQA